MVKITFESLNLTWGIEMERCDFVSTASLAREKDPDVSN
jgi:hypothetical protein